ncbi:MAG: hypothetical protein E7370_05395 [Clostridiales bacterium]|nr:hypothetical protein [Clostridiales bacterium]
MKHTNSFFKFYILDIILPYIHKKINNKVQYSVKLLFIKKSAIIIFALIIILGATCGIFAQASALNFTYSSPATIVIDAGHGGIDPGVLGAITKVKESDINLEIAKYLKEYFSEAGFKVVLTRNSQAGLYGTLAKGFKQRDMKRRKQIILDSKADMVISIHQNFCPSNLRRGAQVFFDKNSESGKSLAIKVQNSLNALKNSVRQYEPLVGDFYILKCSTAPSILVECGFLSNKEDETLLCDSAYKKELAYAIFKGAILYF